MIRCRYLHGSAADGPKEPSSEMPVDIFVGKGGGRRASREKQPDVVVAYPLNQALITIFI